MKDIIRVAIGVTLLLGAWSLHDSVTCMVDRAIGAPLTVYDREPKGRADRYFGEDPIEVSERPESKAKLRTAQQIEILAITMAMASIATLVPGLIRLACLALGWLLMPNLMRSLYADPDRSGPPGDRPAGDEAGGEREPPAPDAA